MTLLGLLMYCCCGQHHVSWLPTVQHEARYPPNLCCSPLGGHLCTCLTFSPLPFAEAQTTGATIPRGAFVSLLNSSMSIKCCGMSKNAILLRQILYLICCESLSPAVSRCGSSNCFLMLIGFRKFFDLHNACQACRPLPVSAVRTYDVASLLPCTVSGQYICFDVTLCVAL